MYAPAVVALTSFQSDETGKMESIVKFLNTKPSATCSAFSPSVPNYAVLSRLVAHQSEMLQGIDTYESFFGSALW